MPDRCAVQRDGRERQRNCGRGDICGKFQYNEYKYDELFGKFVRNNRVEDGVLSEWRLCFVRAVGDCDAHSEFIVGQLVCFFDGQQHILCSFLILFHSGKCV